LSPGLRYSLFIYLLTRVAGLLGVAAFLHDNPAKSLPSLIDKWDGWWYLRLAEYGYSRSLRPPVPRPIDYHHQYSDWAFFPAYPLAIRAVHQVTDLPYAATAIGLSAAFGLLAVWAMYSLGAAYGGPAVGRGAALLMAACPGSGVFLQPYSEGLFMASATAALVLLLKRRWIMAGVLGAVASATRPTGVAVIAAAAAVAVVHLVRHRDPRALLSPALACSGIGGFILFGWERTGDLLVWRHAENLWSQRLDLSHKLIQTWIRTVSHPGVAIRTQGGQATLAATVLGIGGAVALVVVLAAVWARRRELSLPLAVYGLTAVLMIVCYSAVGPRPRTLLAVVPAFVWVAAWWPRRVTIVVAVCATPLIAVVSYLWLWDVTP
jgi:hypothetical protein